MRDNKDLTMIASSVRKTLLTAMVCVMLAGMYNSNQAYANNFNQYLEQYNSSMNDGNKQEAALAAIKVAEHLIDNNEFKPALNYLTQAKTLFSEVEDLENLRITCREIAFIHSELNNPSEAISSLKEAIEVDKSIDNPSFLAEDEYELGLIYADTKKNKTAYKTLASSFNNALKTDNISLQKEICIELIRVAQKAKKNKEAIQHQNQLREIEDQLFEIEKQEREQIIASITDEKLKAEMEADLMAKEKDHEIQMREFEISQLDATIDKQDSTLSQKELHLQLAHKENVEKQMSLDLMSKEKELDDLKIRELKEKEETQKQLITLFVIIAILIGGIALVLIRSIRQHKQDKRAIKSKNKEIREQHGSIVESINYAQRIQEAMLPQQDNLDKYIPQNLIYFRPRDIVSGDFYWFYPLDRLNGEGYLIAAIDCTGHGVPGALVSMIASNLLNRIVDKGITEPGKILDNLHVEVGKALKQEKTENNDGMDMVICRYQPQSRTLEYAGAKNGLTLVSNGEAIYHKGSSMPIGGLMRRLDQNYPTSKLILKANDAIYLFSDGFQDQFGGPKNKKFSRKRLNDLLVTITPLPSNEQVIYLDKAFSSWRGSEKQIDDVLVLGFKA